jgi:hypothetical protein
MSTPALEASTEWSPHPRVGLLASRIRQDFEHPSKGAHHCCRQVEIYLVAYKALKHGEHPQ